MRKERDFLGEVSISKEALYGIHAWRARENFPDTSPFPLEWYKAMGLVKQAYYISCISLHEAIIKEKLDGKLMTHLPANDILKHLIERAVEVSQGKHFQHFIVPGISGGAGTSINMNINEIIANASLAGMGHAPGNYDHIDPIEDANIFQSTNDVVPSALKLAIMALLRDLETAVNVLRNTTEKAEKSNRNVLRLGYTQMQAAVPTSWGKLFSTYNDALSRDWWRITRCQERIKVVNLGGSAVGTGLTVPRYIIMEVVKVLQKISGFPLTRGENLADTTANLDPFVEVHATLKAMAVNLEKMSGDLRLLSSDITGKPILKIPARQAGSSVMPGKVNPVIPEFVISAVSRIYANDGMISSLAGKGCLELNAYIPSIGCAMIESLKLLIAACRTLALNLMHDLQIDAQLSEDNLMKNPSIVTAVIPVIGYHQAAKLASHMAEKGIDIFQANLEINAMDQDLLRRSLSPDKLLQLGYSLKEY